MRKGFALGLALTICFGIAYSQWPKWSLYQVSRAITAGDPYTIEKYIDWSEVHHGLASGILAVAVSGGELSQTTGASQSVKNLLQHLLTEEINAKLLINISPPLIERNIEYIGLTDIDEYRVYLIRNGDKIEMILRRQGMLWRIVRVSMRQPPSRGPAEARMHEFEALLAPRPQSESAANSKDNSTVMRFNELLSAKPRGEQPAAGQTQNTAPAYSNSDRKAMDQLYQKK